MSFKKLARVRPKRSRPGSKEDKNQINWYDGMNGLGLVVGQCADARSVEDDVESSLSKCQGCVREGTEARGQEGTKIGRSLHYHVFRLYLMNTIFNGSTRPLPMTTHTFACSQFYWGSLRRHTIVRNVIIMMKSKRSISPDSFN